MLDPFTVRPDRDDWPAIPSTFFWIFFQIGIESIFGSLALRQLQPSCLKEYDGLEL